MARRGTRGELCRAFQPVAREGAHALIGLPAPLELVVSGPTVRGRRTAMGTRHAVIAVVQGSTPCRLSCRVAAFPLPGHPREGCSIPRVVLPSENTPFP